MRFLFLGTGTSQGIPMIGCRCEVCISANSKNRRTRSSVYVDTGEQKFVIDTGADFREQCLREGIDSLDAVVITHSHADHIMGLDDARRFCQLKGGSKLPIYASPHAMEILKRVFFYAFAPGEKPKGYLDAEARVVEKPFWIGNTQLIPLPLKHGEMMVNGYLLIQNDQKKVAYLNDCSHVSEEVMEMVKGTPVLVLDALRYRSHPTHLNIEEAVEVARKIDARRTFFTHFCHEVEHVRLKEELPEGIEPAYDGLSLEL